MQKLTGIAASPGLGIGPVSLFGEVSVASDHSDTCDQHALFHSAVEASRRQIEVLRDRISKISKDEAEIFDSHIVLLDDPMFFDAVDDLISETRTSAEDAVETTMAELSAVFACLDDDYLRSRSADIQDIGCRVLRNLKGNLPEMVSGGIWVAHEMLASEVAAAGEAEVAAIACEQGAMNSHAAILARSLGIPAVFGLNGLLECVSDGDVVIVDGDSGTVVIGADAGARDEYCRQSVSWSSADLLQSLRGKIDVSQITINANIASIADAGKAFAAHADGIGVVRTEFLFAGRKRMPNEEEQYQAYMAIVRAAEGKPVTIRTLDAGSDKPLRYLPTPPEQNPALGLRGLRLSLTIPEVFKIQIRAILRVAAHGNVSILFPMVSNVEEMQTAVSLMEEARTELLSRNVEIGKPMVGAMIEVPSAALNAERIAEIADFLSIGTNDLVQYTLAADRGNGSVAYLYNELDPAVLELIERTVRAGRKFGRKVSVCGEMAAATKALPFLLQAGVRELSMSPLSIGRVRSALQALKTE
jgi:phosphotransferase system enzyme I (PtsI)